MTWVCLTLITALIALSVSQACSRRRLRAELLDAAHELARPLTALRLALTSGGRPLAPEVLDSEVVRAATVVEQLRLLGGAGGVRTNELFDLSCLAQEVSRVWQQIAVEAGGSIKVDAPAPLPVVADRARVGQALSNILANAIEHGEGAVRVALTRIDGACRIEVSNSVAARQASDGRRIQKQNLRGRGLSIVEAAVAASGGRFDSVRAADGQVVIELPLAVNAR